MLLLYKITFADHITSFLSVKFFVKPNPLLFLAKDFACKKRLFVLKCNGQSQFAVN